MTENEKRILTYLSDSWMCGEIEEAAYHRFLDFVVGDDYTKLWMSVVVPGTDEYELGDILSRVEIDVDIKFRVKPK